MVYMVYSRLKRLGSGFLPVFILFVFLIASLYMMSAATENSEQFGRIYLPLLVINVLATIILLVLIAANLYRLIQQYRNHATGSRLTLRLVVMFVIIALAPVSVVYYFSLRFIERGIDTWFDVRIEKAFDDALALSRKSLDERKLGYLKKARDIVAALSVAEDKQIALKLTDLRETHGAYELVLIGRGDHIIASSSANSTTLLPNMPPESILLQVQSGTDYIGLEEISDQGLFIRVVIGNPSPETIGERWVLNALFPVSDQIQSLAGNVQSGYSQYQQLVYLRKPLKFSFKVTLSLVVLLSFLFAVWAAFFAARRLVAPIRVLVIGTRAVASGHYNKRLPSYSNDELGFLVESFNEMTEKISHARDEAERSQQQVRRERAYLRAVLGRLSSGVMTLDRHRVIRTANSALSHILGVELKDIVGVPVRELAATGETGEQLANAVLEGLESGEDWRKEINVYKGGGRQVLMCRGATLPGGEGRAAGHVIVVEDVTALVQAQRDAAWGEVARRLAHEIKNPLTPIRLSAERLRHKYLSRMSPKDASVLDRSTHTIVQQVEVMRDMVQAFSDYARTPDLDLRVVDVNKIINEVLDLYRGHKDTCQFKADLAPDLPALKLDVGRMRQLLHNLIKNAQEAAQGKPCEIHISTRIASAHGQDVLELRIRDNGPGISEKMMGHFFEPYVTTKPKGSGLGLAVVKKIVEEHGGSIRADNPADGGAEIIIHLPLRTARSDGNLREAHEDTLEVSDEYLEGGDRILQQDDKEQPL